MHLIGREPTENRHRDVVAAIQIPFHLSLQIFKRIEFQEIVEALLIIAVAALYFAVMPGRSGTDRLMMHMDFVTKHVKWMNACRFLRVIELRSVVSLDDFRCIHKENDCSLKEVHA